MRLDIRTFAAQAVLNIYVVPGGRAGVSFLNWSIKAKPLADRVIPGEDGVFAGAGLYGLCFDKRLIYIGSYLGSGKAGAFTNGDVVRDRWWTHIGSIVGRGDHMHIARKSLRALEEDPGPQHPLVAGFMAANDRELLHTGQGNLSPLRRLRFAVRNSDDFLGETATPGEVLERFTFTYARLPELPANLSPGEWKNRIKEAERNLIIGLAPECNTEHVPRGMAAVNVSCLHVGALLGEELHGTCGGNPPIFQRGQQ